MIRARIAVGGRVQGVFYRSRVRDIARRMGINGYVRNLYDGRVEVVCECGDEKQLSEFRDAIYIQENIGVYVDKLRIEEKNEEKAPMFKDFEIRYY